MFEFFPIIIFFILYNISNIYYATYYTILVNFLLILFFRIKNKKFSSKLIFSFILILIFGGATILLKDEIYIKLKTSIMYWIFCFLCLFTHFFKKKPFLSIIISSSIELPNNILVNLNKNCGLYFFFMGFLNLYIAYNYSTNIWVNFKFFGTFIITFLFIIFQIFFVFKSMNIKK